MAQFNDDDQLRIKRAIEKAEAATSGEIRICIEKTCSEDVLDRAANYFTSLDMKKTVLRNGVLIYLSTADRKFAIIGDAGINAVVPANFWDSTKDAMLELFKAGDLTGGIVAGIQLAGEQLKTFFPINDSDKNELSDDIAFMEGT